MADHDERVRGWSRASGYDDADLEAEDGTWLRVVVGGKEGGRPVVLLHGAPQFSYAWRAVMRSLEPTHRVFAPDLRGYGASDLARSGRYDLDTLEGDLLRVVDHAAGPHGRALLVAHDWGGPIAWRFAEHHPERLSHLVATNAPHPGAFAAALTDPRQLLRSWYIGLFQVPRLGRLIEQTDARLFLWMMQRSSPSGTFTAEDLDMYRAAFSRPGRAEAVLEYYRQAFGGNVLARRGEAMASPRIEVPTTLLWGEADKALSPRQMELTRPYVARLEVRALAGVSHWVPEERPDAIVDAVRDADRAS